MSGCELPDSYVLKNKYGVTDEEELRWREIGVVRLRVAELEMLGGSSGSFTTSHLKSHSSPSVQEDL